MRKKLLVLVGALAVAILASACIPQPAPAPPSGGAYGPGSVINGAVLPDVVYEAIKAAFEPVGGPQLVDQAIRVARCESGFGIDAVNGQYRGIFQLGNNYNATIAFYGGNVFDPFTNAQVARDSWVTKGHRWDSGAFQCAWAANAPW